jgi:peptide/nickel transport system substrate-binding protein
VPDQTVLVEQYLAGELNYIDKPPANRRADIRSADGVQAVDIEAGVSWDYLGFNLADPENPQPGRDGSGNIVDQGHHPIFGDVKVRRAIQHALNVPDIVQGAVFGEGAQMAAQIVPGSWAYNNDLPPVPYDLDMARQLLDEAGWKSSGDPLVEGGDGARTCDGCLYAEGGTPFEFDLITNAGNTRREAIALVIVDSLGKLGIQVNFEAVDFQVLIDTTFGAQTFDTYILGWGAGFPDDPDTLQLFGSSNDDPTNQASNGVSYYSEEFERLSAEGLKPEVCGDPEARAAIYHQIQELLQADQPYAFLFAQVFMAAAVDTMQNFNPHPYIQERTLSSWYVPSNE